MEQQRQDLMHQKAGVQDELNQRLRELEVSRREMAELEQRAGHDISARERTQLSEIATLREQLEQVQVERWTWRTRKP